MTGSGSWKALKNALIAATNQRNTLSHSNELTDRRIGIRMPDDSELVELLKRAQEGDEQARDQLFARCRPYVNIVAQAQVESWLQAKVDASDLVQQTLLDAHRGMSKFRGESEGEWLAWLRQILKHNATDFVRHYQGTAKRETRREISMQAPTIGYSESRTREPSDRAESPSEFAMRGEREVALAHALAQLQADYREVIELRNLQRLSFNEIATRMDRSRPAVQMLWMRAIRQLQQKLDG